MTFRCPACQRSFSEPGFCPYDGKQTVELEIASKPTVISELLAAQAGPTLNEPDTQVPSVTEVGVGARVRALSAQDGGMNVSEALRGQPSEYDQLVGETLDGRYYIQRKIGEGGMGVVFAAKHAVIERPLAIKVLKREVMRDTATIKRFVQEAQAASRIGHPNIVDVTDFGTTAEGMTYSVMEYVDGTTLSRTIKEHAPLPPERSIRIAIQIARALSAAHDKGIVHRDLKPENVFLIDRDERPDFVKIVDFGIAKVQPLEGAELRPRLTRAGSVFGTPEYMAPEQAAGRGDTDRRVDIYALGTILYEMTVGRTPHKSNSTIRTIAMQMLDPITPPSKVRPDLEISPALEAVIMKALEKKREQRYQTMGELIVALDDANTKLAAPEPSVSLVPLPPGADPNISTTTPPAVLRTGEAPQPPRRAKPETRQLHEPEFVAKGPVMLQQPVYEELEERPTRRWPIVAALMLLVGGGVFWVAHTSHETVAVVREDATRSDATLIAELHDAGETLSDGGVVVIAAPLDAGARTVQRDAGVALRPGEHPKVVTIEVMTRPGETNVFVGHTFRGPSGTKLAEPYGTKLTVECRAPHYKGSVKVVFDGSRDTVMCNAQRLKMCVDGLLNPYDDCEPKTP